MLSQEVISAIEKLLSDELGECVVISNTSTVGGGCINDCYRIQTNCGVFFVKTNSANRYPGMFEAEAKGLQLLKKSETIYIPKVIAFGEATDDSFLVLEYIDSGRKQPAFWEDFGRSLAQMHRNSTDYFGLDHDNYIGSLPQSNHQHNDWISFFIEERLEAQLKRAMESGKINKSTIQQFNRLYTKLKAIFPEEAPALLHGDLWSGNYMAGSNGEPCIIDPAVYYGHREMDIGMSQLFGGFSSKFYDAYNTEYPLENGWQQRIEICNLYPLLVHVNLFGGSYLMQVQSILRRFV